jgi:hypothetical protein
MDRDALKNLHRMATEVRDECHAAYETSLRNRQADGDTSNAYHALVKANNLRDRLYNMVLDLAVQGR